MHSGINTGLVVTGEVDIEKGTHGVAGDTINLASRLQGLAKKGEILAGYDTFRQAEGHYTFETLEPTRIKGKADHVQVYKVLAQKKKPVTTHRLSGLRAELTGRKVEMSELQEAVENLSKGKGRIFSISGDAGTGKSRLVEDFKATLDFDEVQWIEGHAYAYAQNIPYFPLIDLLNGVFRIEEDDPPQRIRSKIESGVKQFFVDSETVTPYFGSLYSLSYPEIENVSPELWKSRLQTSVQAILTSMAKIKPTVFFLEDLHWADISSVELIRKACLEIRQPAIVLCAYRPTFSLFTSHQINNIRGVYQEIRLQDLSLSDAQEMLASLLKTKTLPLDLKRLVQEKTDGNPFYLEELVNTLIESEALIQDDGNWTIVKPISDLDISSSIHGLISGRLDRLDRETKRILQEAAVIGREFLYEILMKITEAKDRIDLELSSLERLDIIRTRSFEPDLEYMFKHPLTQEVVYNGLLKKERQEIHEHIANVMEGLFKERLSEFYETLAFHFSKGQSVNKAVGYLVKAGEKSLARYSVEEAHQYYKKAYDLLAPKGDKTEAEEKLLIDMINSWGYVYYYLGEIDEFVNLLNSHKDLAESLDDEARRGMFYVWLGIALWMAGRSKDAYEHLMIGLELGDGSESQKVIGYACTWLPWACAELGLFDQGIEYGERAQKIAKSFPADQYLFFKSLGGLSYCNLFKSDTKKCFEAAKRLLEYGEKTSNSRSNVFGHWVNSWGYMTVGDMESAIISCGKSAKAALDPFYAMFPLVGLGMAHIFNGQYQKAEEALREPMAFSAKRGIGQLLAIGNFLKGPILVAKGQMKQGLKLIEEAQKNLVNNQRKGWYVLSEVVLGIIYAQIAIGPLPTLGTMAKNIGFFTKTAPFSANKAEEHFNRAINMSKEIGAKGYCGLACLNFGLFHRDKKRIDQANKYLSEAVEIFQQCDAQVYLKQAREALDSLSIAGT
jgi:tetratricopeptide (TPR) repeat protein